MSGTVVVVGSINVDVSVTVDALPRPGETLMAGSVRRSGGGKGANQAVAAARAGGARTLMVGCVGDDGDGADMRRSLTASGVDVRAVTTSRDEPTGTALITVDAAAENTIVVAAGANGVVRVDDVAREALAGADVVLAQLEIPQAVVLEAARARREGALLLLNAAPWAPLLPELLAEVDVLVVNEHEARGLTGHDDVDEAVETLLADVPAVLVTLGAAGSRLQRRGEDAVTVTTPRVTAVDTTGAGDTFCGVLGAALAAGEPERTALQRASAAASIAVERRGAQDAVPTADETTRRHDDTYGGPTGG
ncbi:ribokinase [Terracoccus luteus]|uniref:Ribokinase n=1 Tax=Terracoccus luteus TaxID=53356 RepID=A0A839PT21_9MICO|nr:ribokinase [Terracoccus luteus]MBB2986667.1 ribokinase [Terracoccus luteus]MCP2172318.1 ribokinase [Terracoccus luteus]